MKSSRGSDLVPRALLRINSSVETHEEPVVRFGVAWFVLGMSGVGLFIGQRRKLPGIFLSSSFYPGKREIELTSLVQLPWPNSRKTTPDSTGFFASLGFMFAQLGENKLDEADMKAVWDSEVKHQ
mmetsp:Transcript_3530/g.6688  ORF Transcript_3530/g.6688 Transcript_3530/m.6688 type:complete len:125 (-) Transcript_3530:130-504(-)